jgi:hypothetical protein
VFDSNNKIIISCAGDKELAKEILAYLLASLKPINNRIDDFMTRTVDEIEIVDDESKITSDTIEDRLSQLFKSEPKRFDKFSVTRLENIFTIGEKTDLLIEMKICEYCGYMSKDYHDMYKHRLVCVTASQSGNVFFGKSG